MDRLFNRNSVETVRLLRVEYWVRPHNNEGEMGIVGLLLPQANRCRCVNTSFNFGIAGTSEYSKTLFFLPPNDTEEVGDSVRCCRAALSPTGIFLRHTCFSPRFCHNLSRRIEHFDEAVMVATRRYCISICAHPRTVNTEAISSPTNTQSP